MITHILTLVEKLINRVLKKLSDWDTELSDLAIGLDPT